MTFQRVTRFEGIYSVVIHEPVSPILVYPAKMPMDFRFLPSTQEAKFTLLEDVSLYRPLLAVDTLVPTQLPLSGFGAPYHDMNHHYTQFLSFQLPNSPRLPAYTPQELTISPLLLSDQPTNSDALSVSSLNHFPLHPAPTFGNTTDGYFISSTSNPQSRKRRRPYQTYLDFSPNSTSMGPLGIIHTTAVEPGTVKSLASSSPSEAETASLPRLSLSPSLSAPSPISPLHISISPISLPRSIPILPSPTTSDSISKTNSLRTPKLSSPGRRPPPDLDESLLPHYFSLIEMFSRPRVNVQEYQSVLTPFFVPIKEAAKGEDPTYYQEEEEEEFIDDENDEDYVGSGYRSTRSSRGKRPKRATMKNDRSDRYVARRCLLCGHILSHQSQMNQHIMDHFDIYPFRCYIDGCSFSSTRKADLTKHVREQHEMRELHQCPYCPGALKHERNLRRHIRSKHPYGRIPRSKMVFTSRQGPEEVDSDESNVLEADGGRDQSVHAIPDDYDSRLVEVDRLLVDSQDAALLVPVLPRHTSRLYAS